MIGEIVLSGFNFLRRGTLKCDGSRLDAERYPQLAQIIGTNFAPTNQNEAYLPNLINTFPTGSGVEVNLGSSEPSNQIGTKRQYLGKVPLVDIYDSVGSGGRNIKRDVETITGWLKGLGYIWVSENNLPSVIKLFQSIIKGLAKVGGDGLIEPDKSTLRWLQSDNAPKWRRLPVGGESFGFKNKDAAGLDDGYGFGTDWLADVIVKAGVIYKQRYISAHPNVAIMDLNDSSLSEGGSNSHGGHQTGINLDVRLPKKNGDSGQITWQNEHYDREAMRAQLQAFRETNQIASIFFNDPKLIEEELCSYYEDHDNHAHITISVPERSELIAVAEPKARKLEMNYYIITEDDEMEGFIGEIKLFAGNFEPSNWLFCHGQTLLIRENTALFSLLGTIYGGDGRTTFNLPDLRGRVPVGAQQNQGKVSPAAVIGGVEDKLTNSLSLNYVICVDGLYPTRN
ncbi:tail fiber protein [Vibrio fluvialis]